MQLATKRHIPTLITLSRVLAVPFIILLMIPDTIAYNLAAGILFMLASITDYFDGAAARRYNAVTNLGKYMDPVADKILVTSVLVMLVHEGKIDPYLVMILLGRDLLIGGIRSVAAADRLVIDAKPTGKWKAAMQMLAIPAVLIHLPLWGSVTLATVGYAMLWLSVALSLASGWQYIKAYRDYEGDVKNDISVRTP